MFGFHFNGNKGQVDWHSKAKKMQADIHAQMALGTGQVNWDEIDASQREKFTRVDSVGFLVNRDQISQRVNDPFLETNKDEFHKKKNETKVRKIIKSKFGREPSFSSLSGW